MIWQTEYHNRYSGQTVLVLATGPSLAQLEPHLPRIFATPGLVTMGVNFVYRWVPLHPYKLDYYCTSEYDTLPAVTNYATRYEAHTRRVCSVAESNLGKWANYWWHVRQAVEKPMRAGHFQGLGEDFDWVAHGHNTVAETCMQVAAWLGFGRVLLAGCDFTTEGHVTDADARPAEPNERAKAAMRVALDRMRGAGREVWFVTDTAMEGEVKRGLEGWLA